MEFLDQINPTRYSQSGKEKNENHHQILYIGISLGYKFHFEQTILSFWNKFAKKRYLQQKAEKMNITVEFWIFELF